MKEYAGGFGNLKYSVLRSTYCILQHSGPIGHIYIYIYKQNPQKEKQATSVHPTLIKTFRPSAFFSFTSIKVNKSI